MAAAISNIDRFHSGRALTFSEANEISNEKYTHLIGILGEYAAGKTTMLAAIYLLLAHRELNGFTFKSSLTIPAFEEIAAKAREWANNKPSGAPPHTIVDTKEFPPVLHLEIVDEIGISNLLLTDLPGEWTQDLIATEYKPEQFGFLHRCDCILYCLDAHKLESDIGELRKLRILFERLTKQAELSAHIPIFIVLTKIDLVSNLSQDLLDKVAALSDAFGYSPQLRRIAAWSQSSDIPAGSGVADLVSDILRSNKWQLQVAEKSKSPDGYQNLRNFHSLGLKRS
ncbi:MAG TPA: hypothetical protein V6C81_09625 [Planktothrix sp.]